MNSDGSAAPSVTRATALALSLFARKAEGRGAKVWKEEADRCAAAALEPFATAAFLP